MASISQRANPNLYGPGFYHSPLHNFQQSRPSPGAQSITWQASLPSTPVPDNTQIQNKSWELQQKLAAVNKKQQQQDMLIQEQQKQLTLHAAIQNVVQKSSKKKNKKLTVHFLLYQNQTLLVTRIVQNLVHAVMKDLMGINRA
jgi:hypothetical protein